MGQTLLFPDPKPLDQRLGRKFFRGAPRRPGVYLMKDASGRVVYVGKAKDLKQRINHYRLANPDRMPRRHLRMVREVTRIEFQFCASEAAALRHEAKLLRSLKPRFNRAGVWPGRAQFLVWRRLETRLELGVAEVPSPGWHRYGPLNGVARRLQQACGRLLWLALNDRSASDLPRGWGAGRMPDWIALECGMDGEEVLAGLQHYFWEDPAKFLGWLGHRLAGRTHPFERTLIAADWEPLQNFSVRGAGPKAGSAQLALL